MRPLRGMVVRAGDGQVSRIKALWDLSGFLRTFSVSSGVSIRLYSLAVVNKLPALRHGPARQHQPPRVLLKGRWAKQLQHLTQAATASSSWAQKKYGRLNFVGYMPCTVS